MNHSDYIESSQLQPVPGPEIRPDRQEPGPVPRDLIPREWLENKRLPDVLAHGIVVMAAGPTGLCFLTALHYWMPRSKNIYDGKIWVYNTLEKWCGYTGLPIGTLRRTIDALVNAGIVETWRPNRRQPIRYTLNYPKLRELAKAELIKAGYWPNSECDQIDHTQTAESDQINHTQSDQIDHTQTAESDQINHTQTAESDQNGQTIQETNYSQENKNSQETTTRNQAGGGEFDFEFLESEPRGVVQDCSLKAETPAPEPEPDRNRKQLESLVAKPDQAMADQSPQKHPAGDKSSAADFSAAKEILERLQADYGPIKSRTALARLQGYSPDTLNEAYSQMQSALVQGADAEPIAIFAKRADKLHEKEVAAHQAKMEEQAAKIETARLEKEILAEHRRLYLPLGVIAIESGCRRFGVTTIYDITKRPTEAIAYLTWLKSQPTPQDGSWAL